MFRHFQNVVGLVLARVKQMRRSQLVLFWHHILQYVYRYLGFHRL